MKCSMPADVKEISVLIPLRNEEAYIDDCVASILSQDIPLEDVEILFIDGASTDRTVELLQGYARQHPQIHILHNPNRTVPYAMNIGIRECRGAYIVRLDAHSTYPTNYISKCLHALRTQDCDNAGGLFVTHGRSFMGKAIAGALSSFFGVGNAQFRLGRESGYVDTVPFGTFRRELFDRVGLYDERLTRNQDNELNYRIRKNGGKIYLDTSIHIDYYTRDTLPSLMRMGFLNGAWNVVTMALCPGSMGLRHFIPLLFTLFVVCVPLLYWWTGFSFFSVLLGIVLGAYLMLDGFYAYSVAQKIGMKYLPVLPLIFPAFHLSYGVGSLRGVFMLPGVLRKQPPPTDFGMKK